MEKIIFDDNGQWQLIKYDPFSTIGNLRNPPEKVAGKRKANDKEMKQYHRKLSQEEQEKFGPFGNPRTSGEIEEPDKPLGVKFGVGPGVKTSFPSDKDFNRDLVDEKEWETYPTPSEAEIAQARFQGKDLAPNTKPNRERKAKNLQAKISSELGAHAETDKSNSHLHPEVLKRYNQMLEIYHRQDLHPKDREIVKGHLVAFMKQHKITQKD